MLISRRKEGETVLIGDDIEVRIIGVRKKKVILGIIAPRDRRISASKLSDAELANTLAAANPIELTGLLPAEGAQEEPVFLLEKSTLKKDTIEPIRDGEDQHEH